MYTSTLLAALTGAVITVAVVVLARLVRAGAHRRHTALLREEHAQLAAAVRADRDRLHLLNAAIGERHELLHRLNDAVQDSRDLAAGMARHLDDLDTDGGAQ